jgi:hypothetical protein
MIARLHDSVPDDTKHISAGSAFSAAATVSRAASIAIRARLPQRCRLDGLPYSVFRYGSIALRTRGSTGVVAA